MPGPVSDSYPGLTDDKPFLPSWLYPDNTPKMCPCGHHEGYHAGKGGACVLGRQCGCTGLPAECWTTDEEFGE